MFCFGSFPALLGQRLAAVAATSQGNSLKLSRKISMNDGMGNSVLFSFFKPDLIPSSCTSNKDSILCWRG